MIKWIHAPEKIGEDDLRELASLVERYPYFQAARILYLKALHCSGGSRFRSELKAGTIHLTDHKQLLRYLNNQIQFDTSLESPTEKKELTHIVDKRIQEIQGHMVVTTLGVPAYPTDEQASDREIIEMNFSQPSGVSVAQPNKRPEKIRPVADTGEPVISNPIVLDNIPGVIDDYAEQAPVYAGMQQTYPAYEDIRTSGIPDVTPVYVPAMSTAETDTASIPTPASRHMAMDLDLDESPMEAAANPRPESALPDPVFDTPEIQSSGYQLSGLSGKSAGETPAPPAPRKSKKKKDELIDRFIQNDSGPLKINSEITDHRDLSKENPYATEELFSETLAKIYVKQRLYDKAIATYIKLSLKYPEKSVYFAHRIEEIKEIQ